MDGSQQFDSSEESADSTARTRRDTLIVHVAYPLWRKHTLVTLARARELQDQGNHVVVTYCNSTAGTCAVNYMGSPVACLICRSRVKASAESMGLTTLPLNVADTKLNGGEPQKLSALKTLVEGVRSGIISTFRILPEDMAPGSWLSKIKRRYFANSLGLLNAMNDVIRRIRPVRIEVFNGRHACSRFAIIAAQSAGLPFNTLEITAKQRPILHEGHLVHDRKQIQRRIMRQPVSPDIAEAFFRRRRQPAANKFAKKHATSFEPPKADGFRRKICVFLSSQDEFESLGKDWRSPFPDHARIIMTACLKFPADLFCIRFHPNQSDIVSDIITPFRKIEDLPNARVYYPEDTANTYTLVDWSDLVITFGSTVTVEACWAGKPVIMLGPSYFDELDVSYNPRTIEEFLDLMSQSLPPRDRTNAARVAHYHEFDCNPLRYIKHDGRRLVSDGLTLARPWLSQLARSADIALCHLVKRFTAVKSRPQLPDEKRSTSSNPQMLECRQFHSEQHRTSKETIKEGFRVDVSQIVALQRTCVVRWHAGPSMMKESGFAEIVEKNHLENFSLWHEEDVARRDDLGPERIRQAKRAIDRFNQRRNDLVEMMDRWLVESLNPPAADCPFNSETPGMMIDRLSILSLKEYHMNEEASREDASVDHRARCSAKLGVIRQQIQDLSQALTDLLEQVEAGTRSFRVYYQFKMYNDTQLNPELRKGA